MSALDELSTPSLKERLDAEMTNLTGDHLAPERKRQVAVEMNRVAFELFSRNALDRAGFDEVAAICKPLLPERSR